LSNTAEAICVCGNKPHFLRNLTCFVFEAESYLQF